MLAFIQQRREAAWSDMVGKLNYEIFDRAVAAYDEYCIDELRKAAASSKVGDRKSEVGNPNQSRLAAIQSGAKGIARPDLTALQNLRADLDKPFARSLLLWQKSKEDLVDEMDSTIQVPGWSNIFTQPIINRIEMLATGVRTMIGVKVFGNDLKQIQAVSQQVAEVLRRVPGAVNVVPDQILGKGYLEITIDREKAARYGVNVGDVQDAIEVALGGKPVTEMIDGRERYPIRIRYARDARAGIEQIKNLLISPAPAAMGGDATSGKSGGSMGASPPKTPAAATRARCRSRWPAWPTCGSSKDRRKSRARTACSGRTSSSM